MMLSIIQLNFIQFTLSFFIKYLLQSKLSSWFTDPQSVAPKQASSRKKYLLTGENLQQDQAHGSGGGGVKTLGKERGRRGINVGFEHRHHTCEGHKYKVEPVREVRKDTDLCLTNPPLQLQRTRNTPFPLPLLREELKTLPKIPVS